MTNYLIVSVIVTTRVHCGHHREIMVTAHGYNLTCPSGLYS